MTKIVWTNDVPEPYEGCDVLFICRNHTFSSVQADFAKYATTTRYYIIVDGMALWGARGSDGKKPGVREAVTVFLDNNDEWEEIERFDAKSGLSVLRRIL